MNKLKNIFQKLLKKPLLLPCIMMVLGLVLVTDLFASQELVENHVKGFQALFVNPSTKYLVGLGFFASGLISFRFGAIKIGFISLFIAAIFANLEACYELWTTLKTWVKPS